MAADRLGIQHQVGICQGPPDLILSLKTILGRDSVHAELLGTNHMCWLISIMDRNGGEDLYPQLKTKLLSPGIAGRDRARAEILQTFGYFCSESSGQLTDMLPWFRTTRESRDAYLGKGYAGETGTYPRVIRFLQTHLGNLDFLNTAKVDQFPVEKQTLSRILKTYSLRVEDGAEKTTSTFGNIINKNQLIPNLSQDALIETSLAYRAGRWEPEHLLSVPEPVLALTTQHIDASRLTTTAALSGDPRLLVAAMCMDPLCSSSQGIGKIRQMTSALLDRQKVWLPQFQGKCVIPGIDFGTLPQIDNSPLDGKSYVQMVKNLRKNTQRRPVVKRNAGK